MYTGKILKIKPLSIFNPVEMVEDNKEIFISILNRFLENYKFNDDLFTKG